MDHFGAPCHRSGPKSRSWGKTSELPGVDVLLVSMGKHQNISKPCGRKTPRSPLHKQGLEFIQSCPVVYVPESEARLYKTNVISGMIINPLIGIYSDLYIYIYIPIMWIPIMKWMTMNHTSLVICPGYTHYRYRPYIQELSADPPNYIYICICIYTFVDLTT